jgi:hypothetical protein
MGVVTSILDALRRVGRPTQKSALQRQDKQLQGKTVLSRSRRIVRTEMGTAESLVARTESVPETVVPLTSDEVRPIAENAALIVNFLRTFHHYGAGAWSLDDLDQSFTAWSNAVDKHGYTDEAVIEIVGAAYGQFCIEMLKMRWVKVTDLDGTVVALQGIEKDFRAFPYDSISKRIADREVGFFRTIFVSLQSMSRVDDIRALDAT